MRGPHPSDLEALSLVPLEEKQKPRDKGNEGKKKHKPQSVAAEAPPQKPSSGVPGPFPYFLAPQSTSNDVPKVPSITSQPEGPWSYKKQALATVQPSLPPLAAQPPEFTLPRLDVTTTSNNNRAARNSREELSPGAPMSRASSLDGALPPHPNVRRNSPRQQVASQHLQLQQEQQQHLVEQLQGQAVAMDATHLAQHYGGDNPAAAAAAAFASGYKAIEAAQLHNLHMLERSKGMLSLDTAQLQALQRTGALGDTQLLALQRGFSSPLNRSPTPLNTAWATGEPKQGSETQPQQHRGPNVIIRQGPALSPENSEPPVRLSRFGPAYSLHSTGDFRMHSLAPLFNPPTHSMSLPGSKGWELNVPPPVAPGSGRPDPLKDVFESIAGHLYDPIVDGLRQIDGQGLPAVLPHAITRKALLLKVPVVDEALRLEIPALVEDRSGHACLIILPADKPPVRGEALAIEGLLRELLREPLKAAHKAAAWRSHVLSTMCTDAMVAVRKGMYGLQLSQSMARYAWVVNPACRPSTLTPSLLGQQMSTANIVDLLVETTKPHLQLGVDAQQQPTPGSPPHEQKQKQQQQQGSSQPKQKLVSEESRAYSTKVGAEQLPSHQRVLATLSMAVATSICMADIIRQVEIQCGERGRVLAYTWNAYLSTHEDTMWHIHKENAHLLQENSNLSDEVAVLKNHIDGIEFLRREVVRFRKMVQFDAFNSGQLLKENLNFKESQDNTAKYLKAVEDTVHRELARLRWQHAFHVLGTREKKMHVTSGNLGEAGSFHSLTRKVAMVKELSVAVTQAEKRKRAFGTKRNATEFEHGATYSEIVKSSLSSAYQERWDIGGGNLDDVLLKLPNLQYEAQVLVLASMDEQHRWRVFASLGAEQRAALLVIMSPQMREAARMALPKKMWLATLECMQHSNDLAASLLQVMEPHEALQQFSIWEAAKQIDVLGEMDKKEKLELAARIVRKLPETLRQNLLSHLAEHDPRLAAKILQVLDARGVFSCLDGINEQLHSNVIMSMDVPKAAMVLSEMHYEDAAASLLLEQDEARRTAVLEGMPHKVAANVLVILDYLHKEKEAKRIRQEEEAAAAAAAQSSKDPHKSEDSDDSLDVEQAIRRHSLAGAALLGMNSKEANGIIGHISYEDRANIIRSMDPSKVSEMMALMPPADAVSLLAAISDVSLAVVTDHLPRHEKERLLQALGGYHPCPTSEQAAAGSSWQESLAKSRPGMSAKKGLSSQRSVSIDKPRKEEVKALQARAIEEAVAGSDSSSNSSSTGPSRSGTPRVHRSREPREKTEGRNMRRSSTLGGLSKSRGFSTSGAADNGPYLRRSMTGAKQSERQMRSSLSSFGLRTSASVTTTEPFNLSTGPMRGEDWQTSPTRRMSSSGLHVPRSSGSIPGKDPAHQNLTVQVEDHEPSDPAPCSPASSTPSPITKGISFKVGNKQESPAPTSKGTRRGGAHNARSKLGQPAIPQIVKNAVKTAARDTPEGKLSMDAAQSRNNCALSASWDEVDGKANEPEATSDMAGKLGNVPKSVRLVEAITQYKDEAPRPKGWLLAVVDAVYKEGEIMLRKQGRIELLRKQTLPDIVFFHFMNKYGQPKVASRYVGSLVNSLMLHRTQDQRLENFAKFLSEEWDLTTFVDFLTAQSMLMQPTRIMCAEYPKESGKEEAYAWACYHKCMYVADTVIGACAPEVRERFHMLCFEQCQEVDAATVERARKEKQVGPNDLFPERLFKMPRYLFLRLLCTELQRINFFIGSLAQEKFARMDNQKTGQVPVDALPAYMVQMLPPDTPEAAAASAQSALVQLAAAFEQNVPMSEVKLEEVSSMSGKFFIEATIHNVHIRHYIKTSLLQPAPASTEQSDAEIHSTYLLGVVLRHSRIMMPHLRKWLQEDSGDVLLRDQAAAVISEQRGESKFKAYLHLLGGVINMKVTLMVEAIMKLHPLDTDDLEVALCQLEDLTVLMLQKEDFIMSSEDTTLSDRTARLPVGLRLPRLASVCALRNKVRRSLEAHAACILQSVWRARQARFVLASASALHMRHGPLATLQEEEEESEKNSSHPVQAPQQPPDASPLTHKSEPPQPHGALHSVPDPHWSPFAEYVFPEDQQKVPRSPASGDQQPPEAGVAQELQERALSQAPLATETETGTGQEQPALAGTSREPAPPPEISTSSTLLELPQATSGVPPAAQTPPGASSSSILLEPPQATTAVPPAAQTPAAAQTSPTATPELPQASTPAAPSSPLPPPPQPDLQGQPSGGTQSKDHVASHSEGDQSGASQALEPEPALGPQPETALGGHANQPEQQGSLTEPLSASQPRTPPPEAQEAVAASAAQEHTSPQPQHPRLDLEHTSPRPHSPVDASQDLPRTSPQPSAGQLQDSPQQQQQPQANGNPPQLDPPPEAEHEPPPDPPEASHTIDVQPSQPHPPSPPSTSQPLPVLAPDPAQPIPLDLQPEPGPEASEPEGDTLSPASSGYGSSTRTASPAQQAQQPQPTPTAQQEPAGGQGEGLPPQPPTGDASAYSRSPPFSPVMTPTSHPQLTQVAASPPLPHAQRPALLSSNLSTGAPQVSGNQSSGSISNMVGRDKITSSPFAVTNTIRVSVPPQADGISCSMTGAATLRERPAAREKGFVLSEKNSGSNPLGPIASTAPPMGRPPQVPFQRALAPPPPDLHLGIGGSSLHTNRPLAHRSSGHAAVESPQVSQGVLELAGDAQPQPKLPTPPPPAVPTRYNPGASSLQGVHASLTAPVRLSERKG